jgi:hypothetical protein
MKRINWARVLLGGLLAGCVANLLQFVVNRLYLFRIWNAAGLAPGVPPVTGGGRWLALVAMTFLGGFFAVWLYAISRARYGAGPKTAALAGSFFWLMSSAFPVVLWSLSGPFPVLPVWLLAAHLATYLCIAIVETTAGAWPYRETATLQS